MNPSVNMNVVLPGATAVISPENEFIVAISVSTLVHVPPNAVAVSYTHLTLPTILRV